MEMLLTIVDMRKTLVDKCNKLTPASTLEQQEDYLNGLYHYKIVFTKFCERHNDELFVATDKAYMNVRQMIIDRENANKK
jgi:hypothetical protein